MREFSTPLTVTLPTGGNLTTSLVTNATERPQQVSLSRKTAGGWQDVTATDFLVEVRAVAKGLLVAGVALGDRVGLLSGTRYEWTLFDYAIWYVGGVTVPMYESSTPEHQDWILSDAGTHWVVVETALQARTMREGRAEIGRVWTINDGAVDSLVGSGRTVADEELEHRREQVRPDSPATIVYTSGTTAHPKGCLLSHENFMVEVATAVPALEELFAREDASTLLFMPLAHIFARIVQVGAVHAGVRLGHSPGLRALEEDLTSFRPTFVLGVPRVFEQLVNTASQRAAADGRGRMFDRASESAISMSRRHPGRWAGPMTRARHVFYNRLVYTKLRKALGGQCEYAVSGGAPLGERLTHFYRGLGVTILEGYGLTETTAAVTVNRPNAAKLGTVGQPLEGVAVRVSEDGELQIRGGQVFSGYWNNREATERAFTDDGWLRTGDLGEVDDEGFVTVTGKMTDILVTAGGKSVAPAVLEDRVRAHPLVSHCMVVGDGQPFIGALVTLDAERVAGWAAARNKPADLNLLVDDRELRAEMQLAIDAANQAVSQAEAIRRFVLLPADWTEEGGQLTPSLKLKRRVIARESLGALDELFAP